MTKYILSLDIGTTNVRCILFDENGRSIKTSFSKIDLLYPAQGFVEIDPTQLWSAVKSVINDILQGIDSDLIDALGISSQRCSFILWNKTNGKYYHNFITWKDIRANSLVESINDSFKIKVTPRLLWVLENNPKLIKDANEGQVAFGTVDTWILYKLSGGNLHMTDASNASSTGLFDPFSLEWSQVLLKLFKIPANILPEVVDTAGDHFGVVDSNLFGISIPIRSLIADQSASLFGSCCFKEGETKITLGTGTFLDVNTGSKPHASISGLYPLVGWKYNDELVYMAEGSSYDTGTLVLWSQKLGLCSKIEESSYLALSVKNNGGVFFVPAFSGIQAPVNDPRAASGFIGVGPESTKSHLLRAVLESIAYRAFQLIKALKDETCYKINTIRVDGGVSQNEFILQLISNISNTNIEKSVCPEVAARGAAYLAGIATGMWTDKSHLKPLSTGVTPNSDQDFETFTAWSKIISRFQYYY